MPEGYRKHSQQQYNAKRGLTWVPELVTENNIRLNAQNWDQVAGQPFIDTLCRSVSSAIRLEEDNFTLNLAMVYGSGSSALEPVDMKKHRALFHPYTCQAKLAMSSPGENQSRRRSHDANTHNFTSWLEYCVNMWIIITEKGRMDIALGRVIEVGDVCCILLGVRVPFILKPVSEITYKLVGESYIYNVMRGEIFAQMERGELERENLIIG
ncbi:hypothetical protein B0J11DRAFT_591574 [Dendryphion nanum]|uniref:Uncharacterized protein n=1 Tax=Dendryphion nanum TaxID=256645 RepID=A0A9P9DH21_9PLEO|nr:hypothetical protein B0J11DRAFT_591574 [Dendryphion nanum]